MGKRLVLWGCMLSVLFFFLVVLPSIKKEEFFCGGPSESTTVQTEVVLGQGKAVQMYLSQSPDIRKQQMENASTIIRIGRERKASVTQIKIALSVAHQESKLLNLAYGDADSAGLFQQRPSMNWGTYAQVTDPVYASNAFYAAMEKVPDQGSLSNFAIAMKVQKPSVNAYTSTWDSNHNEAIASDLLSGQPAEIVLAAQDVGTCHKPFFTTEANWKTDSKIKGDDYPYPNSPTWDTVPGGADNPIVKSPLGGLYRECTDFVSWRINEQMGSTKPPFEFKGYGDAASWAQGARAAGYRVDNVPSVGAVAWWGANVGNASLYTGPHGHVAIVSAVNAETGTITIEQYNHLGLHTYSKMELPASYLHFLLFLHIADKGAVAA